MARTSGREERVDAVLALIEAAGSLRLRDAAARLGVTEMTLRRDTAMPDAPLRCLGGWLVPAAMVSDYDLTAETVRHVGAKRAAARAALALIPPGGRVFLDCGTTTTHLAQLLPAGITVVTHSLPVAQIVAARGDLGLELLAGVYHPATASLHRDPPLESGFTVDLAVLSAGGIAADGTVSCSHGHERALKQAVLAAAPRRIVLADRSKLGQVRPVAFARREDFDAVVTGD